MHQNAWTSRRRILLFLLALECQEQTFKLDPIKGAFDIGCIIRWLDYNDTWLAAEWGHPSDNLGAILAVADFISQKNISEGKEPSENEGCLRIYDNGS